MKRQHNDGLRKICGCPRSAWPKCAHAWFFNFKPKGGPHYRFSLDRQLGRHLDSKNEARTEANRLRVAIQAGKFGPQSGPVLATLTLAQLLNTFERRYLYVERPSAVAREHYAILTINRTDIERPDGRHQCFGDWLIVDVTADALEQFRAARLTKHIRFDAGVPRISGGIYGTNRNLQLLRSAFNWALRHDIIERTPFKRAGETVVKLSRELKRSRRLEGDEGERLLQACSPHLRALVEAALESGCRSGELLSLQWSQVRLDHKPELFLPALKTKAKRDRRIPISTRLRAVLEMRRHDPAGRLLPPTAYIFGTEIGKRIGTIKTAWKLTCTRAHITGLRFHDLRRECGSRWLEGGVPLQTVRDWLGHSNISQTSTYLQCTLSGQHEVMRKFEENRKRTQPMVAAKLKPSADRVSH